MHTLARVDSLTGPGNAFSMEILPMSLSAAYGQLCELVTQQRENQNRRFAELMSSWMEAGCRSEHRGADRERSEEPPFHLPPKLPQCCWL